ncbi:MAG: EAL domain-containing protein [Nitrospirota bacterium]
MARPPEHDAELLFGVISIAADAIVMIDEAQRIMLFNRSAEQAFGYAASEVLGRPLDLLLSPRFVEIHRQHVSNFGAGPATSKFMGERQCKIFGRRKDGTEFPAEATISRWKRSSEMIFTVVVRDITERERDRTTIHQLAYYDTLTGFPNRTLFRDLIRQAIVVGREAPKPLAVLLLDLDQFKEINDTLGHHRGDLLLRQVARRLKEVLRPTDAVARLGGDEFGLLLPLAAPEDATLVAQKVQHALEAPFEIEGLPINVETGIGIAIFPSHAGDPDNLLQKADVALYAAKKEGSGHAIYAPHLDPHNPRRLSLLGELRDAIRAGQLILHFQPKLHLLSGRIVGAEALVRWQHPSLGLIPPGEFISPAEQTGLIRPLTLFVLQEAARHCQRWRQAGHRITVAVNLSVRNLQDPQLPACVEGILKDAGVAPDWLELEITESGIMANVQMAIDVTAGLSRLGVGLAIDDFGIGHSSLGILKKLPVRCLKIDRSFVKEMLTSEDDASIVRSTIDLAHSLGLTVVAEGVETQEVLRKLVATGCDEAQGYYICRPMPAAAMLPWLDQASQAPPRAT